MLILDSITTLLESFLYSYTVSYFCDNTKVNKKKVLLNFILITILSSYPLREVFDTVWIRQVISITFIYIVICITYRDNLKAALVSTSVITFIIICIATIIQNNFPNIFMQIYISENNYFYTVFVLCFIRSISAILQLKYIDKMCALYKLIMEEGNYLLVSIIVVDLWCIALNISDNYILGLNNEVLKNILTVLFFLFLTFAFLYMIKISSKSREINRLNLDLMYNNNELRKVKHDYGAQISYLYGLCLMGRYDDLKCALKDVIDASNYSNKISEDSSKSILYLALESAVKSKNIKVSIEERADLYKLEIPEMDLFRVLSNIINNAVEAMNDKGCIFAKSYQLEEEVIILIQNDGPEIPKDALASIFKTGFTTKENKERSHGFGLSIVHELVEKYGGRISVTSSKELTEFRIVFNCCKDRCN